MSLVRRPALGLALALALAACSGDAEPVPTTEAAVGVRASGCSLVAGFGTGVAISPDLVATSAHTVAGAASIAVVDQSGTEHDAEVVGFDPFQDVAILRTASSRSHSSLGMISKADSGVLATWHPDNGFDTTKVVVTRLLRVTIEDIYVEELSERLAFEIEADIVSGDSGAPVFNDEGEIAGIVYARSRERDSIGFVLRSDEITAVLEEVDERSVPNGRCP